MNEYRITRRDPYSNPNCPGHRDVTARQGYYVVAATDNEARAEMARDFPEDGGRFDVQLVKVIDPRTGERTAVDEITNTKEPAR